MTTIELAVRDACVENGWLATDMRIWNMIQHIERAMAAIASRPSPTPQINEKAA